MLCSGPRSQLAGWRLVPYSDKNSELRSDGGICTKDCNPSGNFRPPTSVRRRAGAVVVPHACRHGRAGTPCTGRSRTAPRRRGRCLPSRIVHCAARGAWRMLRVGSRCANTMRRTATVVTRRDSFALIQRPLAARTYGGAAAAGGLEGCVCVRARVCVCVCCVCCAAVFVRGHVPWLCAQCLAVALTCAAASTSSDCAASHPWKPAQSRTRGELAPVSIESTLSTVLA